MRFLIATALALTTFAASATDCERRIATSAPSARTVVLAGGDAWTLFRQFLAEVEQHDLDVSLWRSTVQISRNGRIETYELGLMKALSNGSAEKQWERLLKGKRADLSPPLLAEARASRWDVVCVGAPKSNGAGGQPPKPPAVRPSTSEATVFFKNGVQYAARGDYTNALKEFQAAERIAPAFDGLAMNLGVTFLALRDYVRASAYLKRAIEQKPRDPAAHYNMACLLARLGQREEAIASLRTAQSHGMKMTANVRQDPDLSSLRGRSDFEMLFQ